MTTLAVRLFASEHDPGRPFDGYLFGLEELIAFAWAFAASGSVSGPLALGVFGDRRRGIVMGVALAIAIVAASCVAVFGYPAFVARWYGVPPQDAGRFRGRMIEYGCIGSMLGLAGGLGVAAVALVAGLGLRRRRSGRLGIALAAVLVAATVFLLPPASARLMGLADHFDWNYTGRGSKASIGAAAGSVTGAMCGLILGVLLARCSSTADARRPPAHAPASSGSPPPT